MTEIRVDQYVYMNRLNRYRFSLVHELAHRILHPDLWKGLSAIYRKTLTPRRNSSSARWFQLLE